MTNIQVFQYNESPIQFEVINGQVMANATLMCKAFGKNPYEFLRGERTKRYIEALRKNSDSVFYETRRGGTESGGQTWIHQELVLEMARRLNPKFALWCNRKIAELLRTGKAELIIGSHTAKALLRVRHCVERTRNRANQNHRTQRTAGSICPRTTRIPR